MERRDLLSCHILHCVWGNNWAAGKGRYSAALQSQMLNEHKPVCLLIVLPLPLLQRQLLVCAFVPLCSTWPLCSVSSQGLCCYLGLSLWDYLSIFLFFFLGLIFSCAITVYLLHSLPNPLCFSFKLSKVISLSEFTPVTVVRCRCLEVFNMLYLGFVSHLSTYNLQRVP